MSETTVGEDFPKQQERVRELLSEAEKLPPQSGFFYVAVCKAALKEAELAMASGDIVRILQAYSELKSIEA